MRSEQIPQQLLLLRRCVFGALKQRDKRHLVRALACAVGKEGGGSGDDKDDGWQSRGSNGMIYRNSDLHDCNDSQLNKRVEKRVISDRSQVQNSVSIERDLINIQLTKK